MFDKTDKLKKLLEVANEDTVSHKQLVQLLDSLLTAVKQVIEKATEQSATATKESRKLLDDAIKYLETERDSIIFGIRDDSEKRVDKLIAKVEKVIAAVKNGEPGPPGAKGDPGQPGTPGKDGSPDTPGQIVDKLESLKGEDRLDASAIKNFPKATAITTGGGGHRQRVHVYDLTSQCDGVAKTFKVPLNFGILGLWSTQAPLIYRPVIDWTEGNRTITLTSEVSAPETGQTLWIQYLK